ncbi:hypothetical protein DUNSADRAFT_12129 [Dunaliella salina]|uniref:EamA domain-containing protein n=1 Tax=Dunaliella salina TaxID=3046 RepID=A0ABQ7GBZ0_DUNSA|nr:hypothetical protein DUNSADRAFT_12129 [Dunaliella salina]|eukprot:KAF5832118.1 hypothetical protein DUNSADRAFT_12129 [Dunaliella salina]
MGWYTKIRLAWGHGVFIISSAAFILSLGTLGVKLLTGSHGEPGTMSPFQVACLPSIVCWFVCSVANGSDWKKLWGGSSTVMLYTILRAILGAGALVLYYLSIEYLPLKDAVTLFFCSPALAALAEWVINRESLSASVIIGGTFTILGVFFVTQPGCFHKLGEATEIESGLAPGRSGGMLLAILAATCNAGAFVAIRMLQGAQTTLTLTWWYHLVVASVTLVPMLLGHPSQVVWRPSYPQLGLLAGITITQLSGQFLLNRGFKLMTATRGSAINVMQVLWSYLWEILILKESLNAVSAMGGVCVMAGVLIVSSNAPPHVSSRERAEAAFARASSGEDPKYTTLPTHDTQETAPLLDNGNDSQEMQPSPRVLQPSQSHHSGPPNPNGQAGFIPGSSQ